MLESMGTHRIIFGNCGKVIGKGPDLESLIGGLAVPFNKCAVLEIYKVPRPLGHAFFGSLVVDVHVYQNRGLTCLGTKNLYV